MAEATSLSDLFAADSPPRAPARMRSATPDSRSGTPIPAFRKPNNTLFLSPGGSEAAPSPSRRRRFDEINGDDDDNPFLNDDDDFEAHMRAFDQPTAHRGRSRSLTPMNVADLDRLQSHMNNGGAEGGRLGDYFDDPFAMQDPLAEPGADEEPAKKKRTIATVNGERLLGEHGFPALIKIAKKWKPKGKGHEVRDLHRILDVYQMWAHTMFPKGQFMYTVGRVEAIARQIPVRHAIDGMYEAYKNPQAIPSAAYEFDMSIEAEAEAAASMTEERQHGISVYGSNGPTSGPEPLFQQPDDDDFGFEDELAAMEEIERGAGSAPARISAPQPPPLEMDDMDEMAAMEEMEREEEARSRRAAAASARAAASRTASVDADSSASSGTTANGSAATTGITTPNEAPSKPVDEEADPWEGLYD